MGKPWGRGEEGVQIDAQDQNSESLARLKGEKLPLWNKDRMTELELRSSVAMVRLLHSGPGEAARVHSHICCCFFVCVELLLLDFLP